MRKEGVDSRPPLPINLDVELFNEIGRVGVVAVKLSHPLCVCVCVHVRTRARALCVRVRACMVMRPIVELGARV